MKILITGAGGFVGSHLLESATRVYGRENVIALTSKEIQGYHCIVHDHQNLGALDSSVFSDIETLIHAAAFTPKSSKDANCLESCNQNITYTAQLLRFRFDNLKKVIYTSTLDVYGHSNCISELTETNPSTLYGASKLYCEHMITAYGISKGVDTQILRLGHIYGPGEEKYQKMLPLTIRNVLLNKPVEIWGDGSELRSFIYINDVVSSIINAIELRTKVDVINIVGGKAQSIRELVQKITDLSGKNIDVIFREAAHKGKDFVFDNRLLKQALLEKETDFEAGLKVEYDYMKAKLKVEAFNG